MAEYKVKLIMSEEYTVRAESKEEAEKLAREKFGCDYYIDSVEVTELEEKKMERPKLVAFVTSKKNKDISAIWEVMEMKYTIKDNVLWITDHRCHTVDIDLDEYDVEIKMKSEMEEKK